MGKEQVPGIGGGSSTAWYIIPGRSYIIRWLNVLHWPFSLWHLSYPVIGACLASSVNWPVLGWTVLAFFLGMGVAAHCFDLIKGDPLRVGLQPVLLGLVGGVALAVAVLIGVYHVIYGLVSPALLPAVLVGIVLAIGYNLEWPYMHGDWQFASWWAVFPLLVGYFAQGIEFQPAIFAAFVFAASSAMAQRVLSTRARFLRRNVHNADCRLYGPYDQEQNTHPWDGVIRMKGWLLAPLDLALQYLNMMMVGLAVGMVLYRLWG